MRDTLRKTSDATLRLGSDDPVEFVLSDATPDRHGDTIDPNGWDLKEFTGNPIALMNHNPDLVVGNWSNVRVVNGQLRGHLNMAPQGTSSRIDEFRRLVLGGIYRATSVGFRPNKTRERPNGGTHYISQTLLECSIVSIPSNPAALRVEAKALGVSESTIKQLIDRPPVNATLAQRQDFARRRLADKKAAKESADAIMRKVNAKVRRQMEESEYPAWERKRDLEVINAHPDDVPAILRRQHIEEWEMLERQRDASSKRKVASRLSRVTKIIERLQRSAYNEPIVNNIVATQLSGDREAFETLLRLAEEYLDKNGVAR